MTITEAAENGTTRDLLVALRDHVARVIDGDCSARDLVGLSRRLVDLVRDIESIDVVAEGAPRLRAVPDDGDFDPEAV